MAAEEETIWRLLTAYSWSREVIAQKSCPGDAILSLCNTVAEKNPEISVSAIVQPPTCFLGKFYCTRLCKEKLTRWLGHFTVWIQTKVERKWKEMKWVEISRIAGKTNAPPPKIYFPHPHISHNLRQVGGSKMWKINNLEERKDGKWSKHLQNPGLKEAVDAIILFPSLFIH